MTSLLSTRGPARHAKSLTLTLKSLTHPEEQNAFLKDIAITLHPGERLLLQGTTGCGKSTLLDVFAGIIPALSSARFEGSLRYGGEKVVFEDYRRLVSYAHQEPENQFILTTVSQELNLYATPEEQERARDLLRLFRLEHAGKKSLRDLSAGQRKMVSLVGTLARDRPIYILDEPTANLDQGRVKILMRMIAHYTKGSIVIVATHDPRLAPLSRNVLRFDEKARRWKRTRSWHETPAPMHADRKGPRQGEEPVVELKDVTSMYTDGTTGIAGITARIPPGAVVAIVGDNGTGKSTLLRIIAGKIKPSSGSCTVRTSRIAMILQEPEKQLFTDTVAHEIAFGLATSPPEQDLAAFLRETGLGGRASIHPYFLSRGQKQLVLLLSVMMHSPDLLMIDEPFTGIDERTSHIVCRLIQEFHRRHHPTIIITGQHDKMIARLCTQHIRLRDRPSPPEVRP